MNDSCRRFLLEDLDIRGGVVRLGPAWQAMLAGRAYAPSVARLLGEMTAVTTIIAGQLKTPGRLSLHLRGSGPINTLLVDCDDALRLRGMARADAGIGEAPVPELLGHGQLAMTLDIPGMSQPFQSIVPLVGTSTADIFQHYLEQSEQQPARLFLAASAQAAAGLFLQKMPGADERDADGWNRVLKLAGTIRPQELLDLDAESLLARLFAEEAVRVFEPQPVQYFCPRDEGKVAAMLVGLGRAEVEAILSEHGEVVIHDEICNHTYRFDAAAIAALFAAQFTESPPRPTLH